MREYIDIVIEGEAWHGSASDFKRFSTAKVGSGQGQAKYGWGAYLSDERERGRFYATLKSPNGVIYQVQYPDGLYLDWDAPLSEQPAVTAAIRMALPEKAEPESSVLSRVQYDALVRHGWRGCEGYKHLARVLSGFACAPRTRLPGHHLSWQR